jgi:D-3-phosphoglycerate dehydrogenase
MDIKILHIDKQQSHFNEAIARTGFENHEDFTSSKEQIEAKNSLIMGLLFEAASKLIKLLDKASNLQFIARVGAGLESIDCDYAVSKKITLCCSRRNRNAVAEHLGMILSLLII